MSFQHKRPDGEFDRPLPKRKTNITQADLEAAERLKEKYLKKAEELNK